MVGNVVRNILGNSLARDSNGLIIESKLNNLYLSYSLNDFKWRAKMAGYSDEQIKEYLKAYKTGDIDFNIN